LTLALSKEIRNLCLDYGCSLVGIAPAGPFLAERERLLEQERKGGPIPFAGRDIISRTEPSLLLPGVKSIISLGFTYRTPEAPHEAGDVPRGTFSRFARIKDYHKVLNDKMAAICQDIRALKPGVAFRYCADTGPLLDRAVAFRAGLGFWGKNNCLINEKLGSYFFLGEILLDIPLEPDSNAPGNGCKGCQRCLNACPTRALEKANFLNYRVCLSHISQSGDFISPSLRPLLATMLYGCDLCQEACPYNEKSHPASIDKDFLPERETHPELLPLLDLSKKGFAAKFRDSPLFWRGRNILQRNAVIALGNLKAEEAEPRLGQLLLEDPRPLIRGYSAWALGRTGGKRGLSMLAKGLKDEKDPSVLQEIAGALYERQTH
jgi:epoxyqueuosine reductase